jgi:hypothetical protein
LTATPASRAALSLRIAQRQGSVAYTTGNKAKTSIRRYPQPDAKRLFCLGVRVTTILARCLLRLWQDRHEISNPPVPNEGCHGNVAKLGETKTGLGSVLRRFFCARVKDGPHPAIA